MALKEDIEAIKQEIVGEEEFFEHYVKAERFFKKHKEKLKSLTMIITAVFTWYIVSSSLEAKRLADSNELYLKYINKNDKNALSELKKVNPKLYDLVVLKNAIKNKDIAKLKELTNSKTFMVSKIAKYHIASITKDEKALKEYTLSEDAILKDFASIQLGFKMLQKNKTKEAKRVFDAIAFESPLKKSALLLEHFGI